MVVDILVNFFSNKQAFTYVILSLYILNCIFQFVYTKDYAWGSYWASAACITLSAMTMSQR